MGSVFGDLFTVATFGESHGTALGCIIDGCPAGLALSAADFEADMQRRRPGYSSCSSSRRETDEAEILSGLFEGMTTGSPIAIVIRNVDQKSEDYDDLARVLRPGHADFTYLEKYGIRDHRGGGRASGRETVARVAAGVVAKKILSEIGVSALAFVSDMGDIPIDGDSIGSAVTCVISGLSPGIGLPVFDKLSADLAKAVMSIGGTKGVEFGAGFAAVAKKGSENNDGFVWDNGKIRKTSNNAGGILGGISDGDDICLRVAFKPPPSICLPQFTADMDGENVEIAIEGRHDPVIAPRACVVVEAMVAIVLVNHIFAGFADTMERVKKAYGHP